MLRMILMSLFLKFPRRRRRRRRRLLQQRSSITPRVCCSKARVARQTSRHDHLSLSRSATRPAAAE